MTQSIPYQTPGMPLDFPDRRGGLTAFGIIFIVLGSLAGCVALLSPIGIIAAHMQPNPQINTPVGAIISAVILYAGFAVGFIWTGIGSLRARRWVRPIVLSVGAIWLGVGIIAMVFLSLSLPTMRASMQASAPPTATPMPPGVFAAVAAFAAIFSLLIYIVLPAVFVWFYRSQNVRRTLEFYDPVARWTDRCPTPVLGMAIWSLLGCAGCLMSATYLAVPAFGKILTGLPAIVMLLAVAATFATSAVLIYRLRIVGCWLAVGLTALLSASAVVTFIRVDVAEFASVMGMPLQQADIMRASPIMNPVVAGIGAFVIVSFMVGYTIHLRRYFAASPSPLPE